MAVILHEIAHGYVADKLGDPTAKALGRLSLNPKVHIDFKMTILLPAMMILAAKLAGFPPIVFGGAKPVPVNPYNLKNPRKDMMWVALAGPVTNFVLAIIFYLIFLLLSIIPTQPYALWLQSLIVWWVVYGIFVNILLGVFNLTPVPPLDGGRIAVGLLPLKYARKFAQLEPYGLLIVIALLLSGFLEMILSPLLVFVAKHIFFF